MTSSTLTSTSPDVSLALVLFVVLPCLAVHAWRMTRARRVAAATWRV